jgi:hypothetical protein
MSDQERMPRRLLEASDEDCAPHRALLQAARDEAPTREKVEAWLAVGAAAGGGGAGPAPGGHLGWSKVVASLGAVVVAGVVVVLVLGRRAHEAPASPPSSELVAPEVQTATPDPTAPFAVAAAAAAAAAPAESASTAPLPSAGSPSARGPVAASASSTATSSLEAELARLREARSQLASGNAGGALATVSRYEREFPRGMLRPEAEAIAVDALVASGRTAEARARARRFVNAFGTSPQAERMRAIAGPN